MGTVNGGSGPTAVILSWSGGKDSALALDEPRQDPRFEVVGLMTSVSEEFRRINHHGVREQPLEAQADAIGLPLMKIDIASGGAGPCTNEIDEELMGAVLAEFRAQGVFTVGFGDLFLEDLRAWREASLAEAGMSGVFPIWGRATRVLAREAVAIGFRAILSCVEGKVGPGFAGRPFDEDLLADLPDGIDPCGEYGEFHTFVHDGPCFARPVPVAVGETVICDGRCSADLLPAGWSPVVPRLAGDIAPVGIPAGRPGLIPD